MRSLTPLRGRWTAPARWATTHSFCSRTSRRSGGSDPSRSCAASAGPISSMAKAYPAIVAGMSPRTRVYAIVAAVCVAAGGAAAGIVLAAGGGSHGSSLQKGNPPLELDLGLRTDPEASAVRAAQRLYLRGKLPQAEAAFSRFHSLEAQIGTAMAGWPGQTVGHLEALAASHPRNASVLLNLGFALFWEGRRDLATAAWKRAAHVQPDTPSAVRAGDL